MTATRAAILVDLAAEYADLDALVGELPSADWNRPTPASGWTIAHQIAHLAEGERNAVLAATDPDGFQALRERALAEFDTYSDHITHERARRPPGDLLTTWRGERAALLGALPAVPEGTRLPWFGPPMSVASMATARLMETWAHGVDVADALCTCRQPTSRLRHVAHISVRTRDFAFTMNRRHPPEQHFRVELRAPSGELWTWGPDDATQQVFGPALDFCLLATQRRHRADLDVVAFGPDANTWLDIAQAYAGPPGTGRNPGQFSGRSGKRCHAGVAETD